MTWRAAHAGGAMRGRTEEEERGKGEMGIKERERGE